MRSAIALAAVLTSACGSAAATPTHSVSPPFSATAVAIAPTLPSASPTTSPKLELPLLVLDVRAGSDVSQPGTIPPRPGGSLTRGPETHAVDEDGVVWLFDLAKSRMVGYQRGRFLRAVAVNIDLPGGVAALLAVSGKFYLREIDDRGAAYTEIEIDGASGRTLRRADLRGGGGSIYPYERVALGALPNAAKGVDDVVGHDALGNAYQRHYFAQWSAGQCFSVIRRISPGGQVLAEACFDVGSYARDYFVARDGSVYQLEQLYTGDKLDRFAVTRIMAPAR